MRQFPGAVPEEYDGRLAAIVRVIEYMKSELSRPLPLVVLARLASFSPFYFHRLFTQATSMTPARFLAALRMAEARRLLLHSSLTVTAISAQVGYSSVGTFTTQFRRWVSLPPERFRRLARQLIGVSVAALLPVIHGRVLVAGRASRALMHLDTGDLPGLLLATVTPRDGGRNQWWAAAPRPLPAALPPTVPPGEHQARVLLLRPDRDATAALVDGVPDSFLTGDAQLRLPAKTGVDRGVRSAVGTTVTVPVRPVRVTDPPLLSATPLRWLLGVSQAGWRGRAPMTAEWHVLRTA
ncbi:AraC family transcriptional regulator [Verrucosispora sp. WMMD573]|uniref:helix-turn-helix domain-containing protein n=1 Tax=Verrucosispora sp. WMMD573 TaxID=3015149 RepID=UPI00248CB873|nr:AraC family transcriptional regulator [Verrucosispora sp. WMMD573]WBB53766.1 AraC family transcriptional regulator [Verrucosispora sp. WMMD573]